MKKISIITINWNNAEGLKKTMQSVIPQLNNECEYIIVDGDSTDGSKDLIRQYEQQLTHWFSGPKAGIYPDMNKGILKAEGTYLLFLNSGDWLVENALPCMLHECTGEEVIYFNSYLYYTEGNVLEQKYPATLTMRDFFKRTIGHQSTLIRKKLFDEYGLYNEKNTIHSDYEFWLKSIIIGNCSCKYVDAFISYYEMSGRSSKPTAQSEAEVQAILHRLLPERVLADYEYWHRWEKEMTIMTWYRKQDMLYKMLVFIYKVIKKIKRF